MAYTYHSESHENITEALTAVYNGRVASYALEMTSINDVINKFSHEEKDEFLVNKMETINKRLTNKFWSMKGHFSEAWLTKRTN